MEDEREKHAPESIEPKDRRKAEEEEELNVHVTYEIIRRAGEDELQRPPSGLAWSGLAAGLSMGLSLLTESFLSHHLPTATWTPLVTRLGYSVGFIAIILGNQQLYTENTLTAVVPVLARKQEGALRVMLRLWGVVLLANLVGALLFALWVNIPGLFDSDVMKSIDHVAMHSLEHDPLQTFGLAIFAGWLVALLVWMLATVKETKLFVIIIITYIIGIGGFPHIIAGAVSVSHAALRGLATWDTALLGYVVPTLLGNTLGGVALVAALGHAQVEPNEEEQLP